MTALLSPCGLRDYRITIWGESHIVRARSRAAARYADWRAFREAGYRADLPAFARMIRVAVVPLTPSAGDRRPRRPAAPSRISGSTDADPTAAPRRLMSPAGTTGRLSTGETR